MKAFWSFTGKVVITGNMPMLKELGANAFFYAKNKDSVISLDSASALASISFSTFAYYGGKLSLQGT